MTRSISSLALLCAALSLSACDLALDLDRARPIADSGGALNACTGCHGDPVRESEPLVRAAPPASALGSDAGAHLAHLAGGTFRAPLACAECHYVPTLVDHADGEVAVPMTGLATADGAAPSWDAASATCSGVYCHGATLGGGPARTPAWSSTTGLGCTSCHGAPPPAPHAATTTCGLCHAGYTETSVNLATHLNGAPDVSGGHAAGYADPAVHGHDVNRGGLDTCQACHGADLNGGAAGISCNGCHGGTAWQTTCTFCHGTSPSGPASPPVDTQGRSDRANVSVGAHAAHVGTAIAAPLLCTDCHPNRAGSNVLTDPAHVDGDGRAEVVLGARAGASATYVRVSDGSATCASTYCHGAAAIEWTGTAALGCASCHGAPPTANGHTSSTNCGGCHDGYTQSSVNPATHLDGTPQASAGHAPGYADPAAHGHDANRLGLDTCQACHGADLNGGTSGRSCNACHATNGYPDWQTTCTFCHGTSPSGPASPPVDTQGRSIATNVSVGAHEAHVTTTLTATPIGCTECHPDRAGSNVVTDAAHVDGDGRAEVVLGARAGASATYVRVSDTSATCASTACHGTATVEWTSPLALGCTSCHGAPPASHASTADCGGCHPGYTQSSVNPVTHLDGTPQATSPHASGYLDPAAHGYDASRLGLAGCKSCHGTALAFCNTCHGGTAWQTTCTFCHGNPATLVASPPVDTRGRSLTANVSVGAHAAHVATTIATPFACTECHPDRAGSNVTTDAAHLDGDGIAEVVLGTLAKTKGAAATYTRASDTSATCASTWCHGKFTGGTAATVSWTSTTAMTCTSCHGSPPVAPHTTSTSCGACHSGYTPSSVSAATHVDGTVQYTSPHAAGYILPANHGYDVNRGGLASCKTCHGTDLAKCDGCHGGAAWRTSCAFCHGTSPSGPFSPPVDILGRSLTSNVSVGAHAAHVATTMTAPLACTVCHPDRAGSNVTTDAAHIDGNARAEVVFGARAGASATYARVSDTSATCSSTACHGAAAIEWTSTANLGCTSCHGSPPPAPHTTSTACGACHPGYTQSSVNAATHIDGTPQYTSPHAAGYSAGNVHGYDVNRGGLASCKTCHGTDLGKCNSCHSGWQTNCTFCHGTSPSGPASPPVDIQGRSVTTNVSVGAHAAHVATTMTAPIACTVCHPDRTGSNVTTDAAHIDGNARAEVVFGARAGASATYARASDTSATCASTYCHGTATVQWTSTANLGCTSCHGAPPASHAATADCGGCHPGYTASSVNAATHLDGTPQYTSPHAAGYSAGNVHGYEVNQAGFASCTSCHGTALASCNTCHGGTAWQTTCTFCHGTSPSGPASPPVDTRGRSVTTNVSVGAHEAHVGTAITASPIACTECHPDRAGSNASTDPAHVDGDGIAEVQFGALATHGGAPATYARTSDTLSTCSATYCHGASEVVWTSPLAAGCASCHGAPPASHGPSTDCGMCHTGYTQTSVNPATHLDGEVQVSSPHAAGYSAKTAHGYEVNRSGMASCKTCHGADLASCTACHTTAGHADWATSCTFCHGTSPSGPASPPVDTQGGTATTNVSVGVHASHVGTTIATPLACTECHADRSASNVITDAAHVDGGGIAEVALGTLARTGGALATYTRTNATTATCASTYCHGKFTGGTAATVDWTSTSPVGCGSCHGSPPSTGVHGPHAAPYDLPPVACTNCHNAVVSDSGTITGQALHVNGTDDVKFGGSWYARTVSGTWTAASRRCSNLACHGDSNW